MLCTNMADKKKKKKKKKKNFGFFQKKKKKKKPKGSDKSEGKLVNDGMLVEVADGRQDLSQNRGHHHFLHSIRKVRQKIMARALKSERKHR